MHGQESYLSRTDKPVLAIDVTALVRKPDRIGTPAGRCRVMHYYRHEAPYLVSQTLAPGSKSLQKAMESC
jgi:hypothetical protein